MKHYILGSSDGNGIVFFWFPRNFKLRYNPKYPGPAISICLWLFGISFCWGSPCRPKTEKKDPEFYWSMYK